MCGDAVKEPSSLDLKKKDKAQRTWKKVAMIIQAKRECKSLLILSLQLTVISPICVVEKIMCAHTFKQYRIIQKDLSTSSRYTVLRPIYR
jgi:hypothetical protein